MEASSSVLPALATPEIFAFPYPQPYDIQLQLMQTVFRAIEDRKIAIVRVDGTTGGQSCDADTWAGRIAYGNRQILDPPHLDPHLACGTSAQAR